jgi:hypothetical protein
MKRSIRRYQQRVAKFRRIRILLGHGAWCPRRLYWWDPKMWQPLSRLVMNEPGWWVHEKVIEPARTETRRNERAILRGRDPESVLWPDCKRPHEYYW